MCLRSRELEMQKSHFVIDFLREIFELHHQFFIVIFRLLHIFRCDGNKPCDSKLKIFKVLKKVILELGS